jgi:hypothetical protein
MNTATLRCGTLLTFEARTFVPAVGAVVPCRNHGFCAVESNDQAGRAWLGRPRGRARPRTQRELQECLRHQPTTTVHALRRQRFTLRIIAAAERDGLVDLDLLTGKVVARTPGMSRQNVAGADRRP